MRNKLSTLAFYAQPGVMTSAGRYAALLEPLPRDVAGLAAVAQGLMVHEHMVAAYGVTLSDDDRQWVESCLEADPALREQWRRERRAVVRRHHPDRGVDPLSMSRRLDALDSRFRRLDPSELTQGATP